MGVEFVGQSVASILIVDDDPAIRTVLETYFRSLGYSLHVAGDAMAAMELLDHHTPELVITDVVLPGMNGAALLKHIREAHGKNLPVIMMTGYGSVDSAVDCMKRGASDYFTKPFNLEDLGKTVALLLQINSQEMETQVPGAVDRHIAGYHVERLLDRGNMSRIYLVRKSGVEDPTRYILKAYCMEMVTQSTRQRILQGFENEVKALSLVEHPNVVRLYDSGINELDQTPYVILEYVNGSNLRELVARGLTLTMSGKVQIIRQIADGLAAIHAKGIVHRDIKPDNVLVSAEYEAKLADFSIAQLRGNTVIAQEIVGSLAYLAPEAFDSPTVDHRADIFSLGAMSYELWLGKPAFAGDSFSRWNYLVRHEPPTDPITIIPDFPLLLRGMLSKMLKKSPDERYDSAAQIAEELKEYLEQAVTHSFDSTILRFVKDVCDQDWQ